MRTRISTGVSALVVLLPLLNVYASFVDGLGFGDFLLALCVPILIGKCVIENVKLDSAFRSGFLFFIYSVVITLLNIALFGYSFRDGLIRILVELFYLLIIFLVVTTDSFDISKGMTYYRTFVIITSIVVLIQTIMHYFFSENVFFLIPGLSYNQSTLRNYELYTSAYNQMYSYSFRPTALFLEPSHMALFLCPYILMALFKNKVNRKEYLIILLASVSVILTTSGTGYLLLAVIWGSYFIKAFRNGRCSVKTFVFILLVLVVVIYVTISSPYFDVLIDRIKDVGSGSDSSINVRLLKGFKFWESLPFFEKMFGMGCGTYDSYISLHASDIASMGYEYMNSVSYILCATGIFGIVLFIIFLYNITKASKSTYKIPMMIMLISMYFTGSTLFSSYDLIYYVVLLTLSAIPSDFDIDFIVNNEIKCMRC